MGVIERLAVLREGSAFAVVAALAWVSASLVSSPQVSIKFVSKAGVEITVAVPSPGPRMVAIEDDDREFQEDNLEPCALPGVQLDLPSSLNLSQFTTAHFVALSSLTPAQRPLQC
jgi:hypothetical protein